MLESCEMVRWFLFWNEPSPIRTLFYFYRCLDLGPSDDRCISLVSGFLCTASCTLRLHMKNVRGRPHTQDLFRFLTVDKAPAVDKSSVTFKLQ